MELVLKNIKRWSQDFSGHVWGVPRILPSHTLSIIVKPQRDPLDDYELDTVVGVDVWTGSDMDQMLRYALDYPSVFVPPFQSGRWDMHKYAGEKRIIVRGHSLDSAAAVARYPHAHIIVL